MTDPNSQVQESATSTKRERLPMRSEENRLLEVCRTLPGEAIGVMSLGRAQSAEHLASERSDARVAAWYLDGYQAMLAREHMAPDHRVHVACEADWPLDPMDLAAICLSRSGEAELTRDVIQSAFHRLRIRGHLAVSVDNPKDRWVHELLKSYSKHVKVRPFDDATVYLVEKEAELKKLKDFSCEVTFRDCDETIKLITRPGVFSHREFDQGARQLLDAVDVFPEAKLLDIGCGSGAVSLGLAARDPSAQVFAFDSNARAVACTREGARLNGFENVTVDHHWEGPYRAQAMFDMALANPPYFGDMRIAEWFCLVASRSLRVGGRLVLVTKQPKWYAENLPQWFSDVEVYESRRYHIASGLKVSE